MIQRLFFLLSCPFAVLLGVSALSFIALAAAISSEAFLDLEPCILCIYQRWPYALVLLVGLLSLALKKHIPMQVGLGVSALAFFVNSAIAFYHTGVEQKWWISAIEGCAVPDLSGEPKSILENIMSAPTANCAEIPWQDPILGLSMANYNIVFCFGLGVLCVLSLILSRGKQAH